MAWTPEDTLNAAQHVKDIVMVGRDGTEFLLELIKQVERDDPAVGKEVSGGLVHDSHCHGCPHRPLGGGYSLIGGVSENFHPEDH